MNALKAIGVSRRYGKQEVLKDFSLSIEAGSFEALMGPSGSGKSTFLHIAAGLLGADAGSVEIGGEDVTKMSDTAATKFRRRHVGVVFQAFNLLNEKTVRENVLLPIQLDGKSKSKVEVEQRRFGIPSGSGMQRRKLRRPMLLQRKHLPLPCWLQVQPPAGHWYAVWLPSRTDVHHAIRSL